MIDGQDLGLLLAIGEIGAGTQDVLEPAVGPGAELERVAAGGVEALRLVAPGQPEHAVAGAEAVLGIVLPLHERDDEVEDVGPDIARVLLQLGAGGLDAGALVGLRLVLLDGGGAATGVAADVAGDVPAPEEHVDQVAARADVDLLADELMGTE